jgi:hypothetical protein
MSYARPNSTTWPLPPRDALRLRHTLEAATKPVAYTRDRERAVLDIDEIAGDAARAVTDTTRAQFQTSRGGRSTARKVG